MSYLQPRPTRQEIVADAIARLKADLAAILSPSKAEPS